MHLFYENLYEFLIELDLHPKNAFRPKAQANIFLNVGTYFGDMVIRFLPKFALDFFVHSCIFSFSAFLSTIGYFPVLHVL